jgi:anti-anti-sigma regulatory factor
MATIETFTHDDVVLLCVSGEMDIDSTTAVGIAFLNAGKDAAEQQKRLVVDLEKTSGFTSAFLGKLVFLRQVAKQYGVQAKLRNVPTELLILLRRYGLEDGDAGSGIPV